MVKAIPIKEISPPKVAKRLLRPDIYGRSALTRQGVQAFPKTKEITLLASTGSGSTVLQSSSHWLVTLALLSSLCLSHWPMLEGCCFSCIVPSQIQMSTQAVSQDLLMLPESALLVFHSLGCVMETVSSLLIPVHFASALCCRNWWLWN